MEDFELQTLLEKALSPLTAILTRQMGKPGGDQAGSAGQVVKGLSMSFFKQRLEDIGGTAWGTVLGTFRLSYGMELPISVRDDLGD